MNNFIKLNSSLFDHPDHFEFVKTLSSPTILNFQRGFKIFEDSAYEGDFENVVILKEGESFIM